MAAGAQIEKWTGPSRRRTPRYRVQTPVDLTVLRSGVPDTMPGRSVNVCERGIAAVIAGELVAGESVGVELQLPLTSEPLRTRATVRYQNQLRCGLEFVALTAEERASIRDWAGQAMASVEETSTATPVNTMEKQAAVVKRAAGPLATKVGAKVKLDKGRLFGAAAAVIVLLAGFCWWRWNRAWKELESGPKVSNVDSADKPRAQVPAEVMQKLLVHRVEPVYPTEARKDRLEGTITLNIVVGQDGSVVDMHALNGPDVLARAAMDALRWWKFEPYRINGEPAAVETTLAVEFKK